MKLYSTKVPLLLLLLCLSCSAFAQTDPKSTGYSYANCTGTLNAGVSIASGVVTRTAGSSGYGAAYTQCNEQIAYGTGAIALKVNSTSDVLSFGLTNTGTYNLVPSAIAAPSGSSVGTSLTGPTFGVYLTGSGNLRIFNQESGRLFNPFSCNACVQANDWVKVYSDEGTVRYYVEHAGVDTLLYTSDGNPVTVSYPLLPQISISSSGSQATVKVLKGASTFGTAGTIYVATTGGTYSAGTEADPTTLALAIGGSRPVCGTSGNNTVSIASGTYAGGITAVVSGTSGTPCVFQAATISYPPSVVITNAAHVVTLTITGNYEKWKDVEFKNTSTIRVTTSPGAQEQAGIDTQRSDGWRSDGTGNQLINSVVHDTVNNIVSQTRGGTIVRGNISYNGGYAASDGGAGHCAYVHNLPSDDRSYINNNVFFGCYGLQLQHYNQDGATTVGNMTFDKNVAMNGMFGILGQGPKTDITVSNNHVYNGGIKWGYADEVNIDGVVSSNYSYGDQPFDIQRWAGFTFSGNKAVGKASTQSVMQRFVRKTSEPLASYIFSGNTYYRGRTGEFTTSTSFNIYNQDGSLQNTYTFANWQGQGFDTDSTYYNTANEASTPFAQSVAVRPNTTDVYVIPNVDQTGRATIAIWNWPLASNVTVNLSTAGLVDGQLFDVYTPQTGTKVIDQATYSSGSPTISFPMTTAGTAIARIGDAASTPASTLPEFGVFLVMPGAQGDVSAPNAPSSFASLWAFASQGQPGNVTLSWTVNTSGAATIIEKSTDGTNYTSVTTTAADATSYTVTGLTAVLTYFRIRASKTGLESVNVGPVTERPTPIRCYAATCTR